MKSCAIRCSPAKGRSKSSSTAVRSLCRIKIIAGYGTLLKNSLPLEQTVVAVEVVGRTTIVLVSLKRTWRCERGLQVARGLPISTHATAFSGVDSSYLLLLIVPWPHALPNNLSVDQIFSPDSRARKVVQGKSTFPVPLFSSPQAGSIGKHTVSCTSLVIHIFLCPISDLQNFYDHHE